MKQKLTRSCDCCGGSFKNSRADARFCCGSCRSRAHYSKVKKELAELRALRDEPK